MLALFCERAQEEAFATRPFLASAPLAPTGRGVPTDGGILLTGRWSWATGVMDGNWLIVGCLCGPDDGIYPALALLPASDFTIEDVWQTDGMRATGSNDVVVSDAFVPEHRLARVADIYGGTAPGAARCFRSRFVSWRSFDLFASLTTAPPSAGVSLRCEGARPARLPPVPSRSSSRRPRSGSAFRRAGYAR